jgi:hypothetical protein
VIIIKEHYWNCPKSGQAGNAIDFFVKIRGVTFNEAMTLLSANKQPEGFNPQPAGS